LYQGAASAAPQELSFEIGLQLLPFQTGPNFSPIGPALQNASRREAKRIAQDKFAMSERSPGFARD
jgi:hypothetical protein